MSEFWCRLSRASHNGSFTPPACDRNQSLSQTAGPSIRPALWSIANRRSLQASMVQWQSLSLQLELTSKSVFPIHHHPSVLQLWVSRLIHSFSPGWRSLNKLISNMKPSGPHSARVQVTAMWNPTVIHFQPLA